MEPKPSGLALAQAEFATVGLLLLAALAMALGMLLASHLIGPRRSGPVKQAPYESGMEPVGDARRPFTVRFYLIAVLFLVFDVEVVFLYPWAVLFPRLQAQPGGEHYAWVESLPAGYTPGFWLAAMGVFFGLLLLGFYYEWRRGVFRWN